MPDGKLPPLMPPPRKQRRGFAAMDPAKRHAAAVKGGASVAPENRSFAKDRKLASEAGRKGGLTGGGGRKFRKPMTKAALRRARALRALRALRDE